MIRFFLSLQNSEESQELQTIIRSRFVEAAATKHLRSLRYILVSSVYILMRDYKISCNIGVNFYFNLRYTHLELVDPTHWHPQHQLDPECVAGLLWWDFRTGRAYFSWKFLSRRGSEEPLEAAGSTKQTQVRFLNYSNKLNIGIRLFV